MTLAQRMIVMNAGRAEQIGTPMEVYENPADDVRRRIHRLAGDELPAGQGRRRRAHRTLDDGGAVRSARRAPRMAAARSSSASGPSTSPCRRGRRRAVRAGRDGRAARRRRAGAHRARRRDRSSRALPHGSGIAADRRQPSACRRADPDTRVHCSIRRHRRARCADTHDAARLAISPAVRAPRRRQARARKHAGRDALGYAHGYRMVEVRRQARPPTASHSCCTTPRSIARPMRRGRADALTWRELALLDAGSWHSPKYAGEMLPTLAAIARWAARRTVVACNIEIKPDAGPRARDRRRRRARRRALWARRRRRSRCCRRSRRLPAGRARRGARAAARVARGPDSG